MFLSDLASMFDSNNASRIICVAPALDIKFPRLFRNFDSRHATDDPTIAEAMMATCSSLDLFVPVRIGPSGREEKFISGEYTCGNPTNELIREAHKVFGRDRMVSCIISIGAGDSHSIPLKGTDLCPQVSAAVAIDSEKTDREIERRIGGLHIYYRFTGPQGLGFNLSYDQLDVIISYTKSYLERQAVDKKLDQALQSFLWPEEIPIGDICRFTTCFLGPT